MNTWLTNFSEYNCILNALCITCIKRKLCMSGNKLLIKLGSDGLDFCKGVGYIREESNETEKRP